ncbi:hypothetical protein P7D22_08695 [Lichenihabitans sp. Uapishka_5]|uniref:hypothetical protein n=1 Tax=Lichenihabitans sp. Uapishka_5 TaxID=3037302 RepID=UPI0029E7EA52|nr:hypothetical protein [Lichenihabitans sp. Uapishka_5]MDX7951254.1 hypothetical protein [Lichenihabitans sp. Uapishka_5]
MATRRHDGTCPFCGSGVDPAFITCKGCGATWTGSVNLLGLALFAAALPCGVIAAILVGVQTRSPEMGMVTLFVVGLGTAALSRQFRTWLWVR